MKKLAWGLGVLAVLGAAAFFSLPRIVDQRMNAVVYPPPYQVPERAKALHAKLFVADLHDDALLWSRDILARHGHGHSDLPRLQEGRVSLQVFTVVTKTPKGQNFDRNGADTDNITMLAMAQRWPPRTWGSLLERALYQAGKLHTAAKESGGRMVFVRSQAELAAATREPMGGRVAALLGTEGLHPLEGRLENVDRLHEAGFRVAGLTHFFDNEVGGSAHGLQKGGLTPFGRDVVRRLEEKKIIIDLAHASPKVIDDVLAMAKRPVIVSHTGVQATCRGPRNLSAAHIRAIAANGGLIGVGFFEGAVCGLSVPSIVAAMRHVVHLVGVKHVALGSDFDGATKVPFDATGMALLTEGLLKDGFSEDDVAAIMGGNVRRFLSEQLPP